MNGTHNSIPDSRNGDILISINGELYPRNEAKISVFEPVIEIDGRVIGNGRQGPETFRIRSWYESLIEVEAAKP